MISITWSNVYQSCEILPIAIGMTFDEKNKNI